MTLELSQIEALIVSHELHLSCQFYEEEPPEEGEEAMQAAHLADLKRVCARLDRLLDD